MTFEEIKAHMKMQLEFESPNWSIIKQLAEEAVFIKDNLNYDHKPKEKKNVSSK